MSLDSALDLAEVARASEVPRENPPYGPEAIFGERMRNDPKDTFTPLVGDGLWEAWRALFGSLSVGGSAISAAELPIEGTQLGFRSKLLEQLAPIHTSGIWWRYYSGDLDPRTLTPQAYTGLLITRSLRGSNLDIQGRDARNNLPDTLKKAIAVARFGYTYPTDGRRRGISSFVYGGRLPVIHFEEMDDATSGGINLIVFPHSQNPDDPWSRVTNLRQWQTRTMVRHKNGHITLQPKEGIAGNIRLVVDDLPRGSWAHQTARSIRSAVIFGIPTENVDTDSFVQKMLKDEQPIPYEDAIGASVNLAVAAAHNLTKTQQLIDATGLRPLLPKRPDTEIAQMLGQGHDELFGAQQLLPHEWGPPDQITHMSQIGQLVAPWLIVPASTLISSTPEPKKRETVQWYPAGQTGMRQDPSLVGDFVHTLYDLAGEQKKGENEAVETLTNAAEAVKNQYSSYLS